MNTDQIAEEAVLGIARELEQRGIVTFHVQNVVNISQPFVKSAIEKARDQWDAEEAGGVGEQRRANQALAAASPATASEKNLPHDP